MKADSGEQEDRDDGARHEVDDETERRPPPGVGDEPRAMLPQVLDAVRRKSDDGQPWRSHDRNRRQDDKCRCGDAPEDWLRQALTLPGIRM